MQILKDGRMPGFVGGKAPLLPFKSSLGGYKCLYSPFSRNAFWDTGNCSVIGQK